MEIISDPEQLKFERAKKRVKTIAGFYRHFAIYIIVNLFLIATNYFNLDPGEKFWEFSTFSTAFFWGIGLLFHALSVFGPNVFLGHDWEEKKIKEYMNRDQQTKWE